MVKKGNSEVEYCRVNKWEGIGKGEEGEYEVKYCRVSREGGRWDRIKDGVRAK